ncbi:unnamed protein product [Ectocarpus sp. CCAP 1310/34]|nr:unnamed protein product [Ectocarpus sp. CCAP 1310/34]
MPKSLDHRPRAPSNAETEERNAGFSPAQASFHKEDPEAQHLLFQTRHAVG